jgi:hypothetical protein
MRAVGHLHMCGLIHRDLKESNFLVVKEAQGQVRVVLLDFAGALVFSREQEVNMLWQERARTFLERADSAPRNTIPPKQASQSQRFMGAIHQAHPPPPGHDGPSPPLVGNAKLLADGGVNACVHFGGVAGGIGTQYRRVTFRQSSADSCNQAEWTRFDRGAVVIQVLNLAMQEDIMHRWDFIANVDKGRGSKATDPAKPDYKVWDWLQDVPSSPQSLQGTITASQVSQTLLQQQSQESRMHLERLKALALHDMQAGLCGEWERRSSFGVWERKPLASGMASAEWDRHPNTAQALVNLLKGLQPSHAESISPCQASARLLSEAARLLESVSTQ